MKYYYPCLKIVLLASFMFYGVMLSAREEMPSADSVTIFYSQNDQQGWHGVHRGKVLSLGARAIAGEELRQLAQSNTQVTVRISNRSGIIPGTDMYIVNERNLIVARFSVQNVYKSASFGYLLIGYGNFRRVQVGFRVIQLRDDTAAQYAYIHRARGNYYRHSGDTSNALLEYEKAARKNPNHPESRIELGYIYLNDDIHNYALREFMEAHKSRTLIYDREDLHRMYLGILQVHYYNAYLSEMLPSDKIIESIDKGLKIADEALHYFKSDPDIHYFAGMFHYNNPHPEDIKARDHMFAVIEGDPQRIGAYVVLGELYKKHDNHVRAREFAEKALDIDQSHTGAQQLYSSLD